MSTAESPRGRRTRGEDSETNGHEAAKGIPQDLLRMGRHLPQTLRREMDSRPAVVLAAVAGTSFVVGAVFGSRLGRIVLGALIPVGVEYLLKMKIGPGLWERAVDTIEGATKSSAGAGTGRRSTESS